MKTTLRQLETQPDLFLVFETMSGECFGMIRRMEIEDSGPQGRISGIRWIAEGGTELFRERAEAIADLVKASKGGATA